MRRERHITAYEPGELYETRLEETEAWLATTRESK